MKVAAKIFIVCSLFIWFAQARASQEIPSARVFAEKTDEDNKICQFSYESAESAAEAALRYNGIKINRSAIDGMEVYVGAGSFTELPGKNACAVALTVEFYHFQRVKLPNSDKTIFSRVIHCRNGVGGTLSKNKVQDDLNASVKRIIDQCISEIEKKAR